MTDVQYKQKRWDLGDLFPGLGSPEIDDSLKALDEQVREFETYRSKLSEDMEDKLLLEILQAYEGIVRRLSRLGGYGSLKFSEDTQDQQAQTFRAQMQKQSAEADNRTMFFKLWWKGIADKHAQRLMGASGDYRYWLEALRLQKPYTLSEPEEKIINIKDVNGSSAMVNLYSTITNRYSFELEVDGEVRELTREELSGYYRSPKPELRAAAYQELYRVYENDAPILGMIYQYIARDWRSESIDLRGYTSPISVRNLANDIPDEVVDTLLDVGRENASVFHRFFKLKARWLGMDRLRRYDVYAPIAKTEKSYAYQDAVSMVLDSYNRFDPQIADLARKVFDEDHYDSEVRKGKRSGAFCSTIEPALTPWILQTFDGKPRNVMTMAHELGHAVHSLLADEHTALTQHASLPLAETASTFGEMLTVDFLLEQETDESIKRDILFHQMDDAYATIMRQAYFAMFERDAHHAIAEGVAVDGMHEIYMDNLKDQFGDSLELSEDFKYEWVAIPHFYFAPFYVYAYAFGQLLVLSLYQQYQEEGEAFKPRYFEILSAGGSDSPNEILTRAGIDITKASFWQGGFDVIKSKLDELQAIEVTR
ncbi:MAG: M3 family oligoendopeptidase [Anaerolineales bacterium]|jgi:oligoendopeptidase F